MNKNNMLQPFQAEALAIRNEFMKALYKHFEVVEFNARKLIDERWDADADG